MKAHDFGSMLWTTLNVAKGEIERAARSEERCLPATASSQYDDALLWMREAIKLIEARQQKLQRTMVSA